MSDVEELRRRVEAASERLLNNDRRQRASSDRLSKLVQGIEEQVDAKQVELARREAKITQVMEENDRLAVLVTELLDIIDQIDVPGLANFVDDLVARLSDRVRDAVAAVPDLSDKVPATSAAVLEPAPALDAALDADSDEQTPAAVSDSIPTAPETEPDAISDQSERPQEQIADTKIALHSVAAKANLGNNPGPGLRPDPTRKRPALRAVSGGRRSAPVPDAGAPSAADTGWRDRLGGRDEPHGEDKTLSVDQAGLQSIEVDALIDGQVSIDQLKQRIDARRRRGDGDTEPEQAASEPDILELTMPLPDDAPPSPEADTAAADAEGDGPRSVRSVLEGIIDELEEADSSQQDRSDDEKQRADSGQPSQVDPTLTTKITSALQRISENDGN